MISLQLIEDHAPVEMTQFPGRKDYIWLVLANDENYQEGVKLAALHNAVLPDSFGYMARLQEWLHAFLPDLAVAWTGRGKTALHSMSAMLIQDFNVSQEHPASTLWIEGLS